MRAMRIVPPPLLVTLLLVLPPSAAAFQKSGCAQGECRDCHSLKRAEAALILGKRADKVIKVVFSEVPGLWEVEIEKGGRRSTVYLDFSKSWVIAGQATRIGGKRTAKGADRYLVNQVVFSDIPLEGALVMGNRMGKRRFLVFTDPLCPQCREFHAAMEKAAETDPEVAFFIKLYPLAVHPEAYETAKAIWCSRSLDLLRDAFAGKPIPPATCETTAIDETITLARSLKILSTPAIILPDGRVLAGVGEPGILEQVLER